MKSLVLLHRFRFLLLAIVLIGCWLLFLGVKRALTMDNSLSIWFLKDDPMLVNYQKFQQRFGNDEVVICIVHDPSGLLDSVHLDHFKTITNNLLDHPHVESIIGPGAITIAEKNMVGFSMKDLMDGSYNPEEIRDRLDTYSILKQQLYTDSYQTARFIITLKKTDDFDSKRDIIIEDIKKIIDNSLPPKQTFFGGIGVLYAGLNKLSKADFGFFLMLGYGVMFLVLLILYRKPMILIYALGTIGLSTYVTLGIYGALGQQLNLMTTLLPIIFVLVGIMDITHILNEQSMQFNQTDSRNDIAFRSLLHVVKPGLFNTITTMVGFLSLVTSPMAILSSFGLFAAVGIGLCFLFTYLLGVVILPYQSIGPGFSVSISPQLCLLVEHVLASKKKYSLLCIGLLVISGVGIIFLKNDTYTLGYFPEEDEVVRDHIAMENHWGPYMPLDFLLEPSDHQTLKARSIVKGAVAFSDSVVTKKSVSSVAGFHTLYLSALQQFHPQNFSKLLNSQATLNEADKNINKFYPDLADHFMDTATQTGRITFFGQIVSAKELQKTVDEIQPMANQIFQDMATVYVAGYQPMYSKITQYVTDTQLTSLFTASIVIFFLLSSFLKKFNLALIAVASNFFPVLVMFGLMGLIGIHLDTATASIAVIVLSICVDDTVHYMYQYKKLRDQGHTPAEARLQTTRHVGPAVVTTGILLFCGYSFMMLGALKTVFFFGLLMSSAIGAGVFGEFVLLPLMLSAFDKGTSKTV